MWTSKAQWAEKSRIYLESLGPAAEIDSKVKLILSLRKHTTPSTIPDPEALNSNLLDSWLNGLGDREVGEQDRLGRNESCSSDGHQWSHSDSGSTGLYPVRFL